MNMSKVFPRSLLMECLLAYPYCLSDTKYQICIRAQGSTLLTAAFLVPLAVNTTLSYRVQNFAITFAIVIFLIFVGHN